LAFLALLVLGHGLGEVADIDRLTERDCLDYRVTDWVVHHRGQWPTLTQVAHQLTRLGNPWVATAGVVSIAALLYLFYRRGVPTIRRGEALFWLVIAGGGRVMDQLLKLWFQRERPPVPHRLVLETSFSFPSGHSVFAAVFFTLSAILFARSIPARFRQYRPILIASCLLVALGIAASRVWLGVHYLSDVVGGFVLGLAWAWAACGIRFGWAHLVQRRAAARLRRLAETNPGGLDLT
jgi:undecaprenyl-diphosphatase